MTRLEKVNLPFGPFTAVPPYRDTPRTAKGSLRLLNGFRYSTQASGTFLATSTLLGERLSDKMLMTVPKNTRGFWFPNGQQLCLKCKRPRGVIWIPIPPVLPNYNILMCSPSGVRMLVVLSSILRLT